MVSLKGKSRVGSTRVSEGGQSRPSVGGRNFKVYSENERNKVGDELIRNGIAVNNGVITSCASNPKGGRKSMEKSSGKCSTSENINVRKALADVSNVQGTSATNIARDGFKIKRNGVVGNKGVISSCARNPKGRKSLEKSSGKCGTSENINVKKALADVSNVQANSATNIGRDGSKIKVSAGSSSKIMGVSLRKSFKGRVQINISQSDVQLDASKRALGTDSRAYLDDQKNDTNGGQSVVVTKDRKSLPVPRRVNRADMSNTKENAGSSETAKGQSGLPTKATAGRRVGSQLVNARSHLWKTRGSDGFVQMVQTNVLHASSRKSTKPLVKTALKACTTQRTLKSMSISDPKKSESTAAMSSQDELTILSLPENGLVTDDANHGHPPSNGESNLRIDLSELIPRKKSSRRKSYTSSLMERSKFLKESGEVMEQDNLPNIDNECNQLEVSEYIDEIYQYYWVTEVQNPALANYMSIQTDITPHMRAILINWLIEVHFKFNLMPETLYLTVTLLDQYLSLVTIKKSDMQLVGLTALLLASKYEDFWHPRVKDLISISAESYTRDQMLGMEKLILRKLKFRLNTPTPYVFMVRFLKAAQSDMKLEHMAFFLIDLCLVEYEALAFKPSLLCASALYVARCTLQITPPWTPLLQKHARYEVSQIRGCAEMILKFHKAAGVGKLTVTYEKYSRPEHSGVAAVKPLNRLPL